MKRHGRVSGFHLWVALLVVGLSGCSGSGDVYPELPAIKTDPDRLYVAGLSSGGYMAHQLHLAWPEEIRGAAVFAAGPYGCARDGVSAALQRCMGVSRGVPDLDRTLNIIRQASAEGALGDLEQLAQSRVFIYQAAADPVIQRPVSDVLQKTYAQLVPDGLQSHVGRLAGHGLPTLNQGVACALTASPYVNACGYAGAAESLQHLDGDARRPFRAEVAGQLSKFDQQPLRGASKGMANWGYVYVPQGCVEGDCGLNLVLHGCDQGVEKVGEDFIRLSGYLQQADARQLVTVFPQVKASLPNPKGCWDWWGYESKAFDTRQGPQMQALRGIWQHFSGSR